MVDLGIPRIVREREVAVQHQAGALGSRTGFDQFTINRTVNQRRDASARDGDAEVGVLQDVRFAIDVRVRWNGVRRGRSDHSHARGIAGEEAKTRPRAVHGRRAWEVSKWHDLAARDACGVEGDKLPLACRVENLESVLKEDGKLCAPLVVHPHGVLAHFPDRGAGQHVVELVEQHVLPNRVQLDPALSVV